jgi:hypothetical protein
MLDGSDCKAHTSLAGDIHAKSTRKFDICSLLNSGSRRLFVRSTTGPQFNPKMKFADACRLVERLKGPGLTS